MFFLTSPKYTTGAKRHFKQIAQLVDFDSIENEKKVVSYKKDLLHNITKFYVNLISLDTVTYYKPIKSNPNISVLQEAYCGVNQDE